jgi:hypothetical protein
LFAGKYADKKIDEAGDADQDQQAGGKKIHNKFNRIV